MNTGDPFDAVRKSNPVDSQELPGAPLGMADRILTNRKPGRSRLSGPVRALASMAVVLAVGAVTAAILIGGSGENPVTQRSTTTSSPAVTGTTDPTPTTTTTTSVQSASDEPAPWSSGLLPQSAVPQHLIEDWARAENRTWCSALYPATPLDLGAEDAGWSAEFAGGWAITWDSPSGPGRSSDGGYCPDCGREAFGVAGAGITGTADSLSIWPKQIDWPDGSRAGYGVEGGQAPGSGAPFLAYLLVEGQGCLYNVWSFVGEEHLLDLLTSLRFVEEMQAAPVQLVDRASVETRDLGTAPWDQPRLAAEEVPAVFFEEWNEDLRTTACPMMAPTDLGPDGEGAVARRANGANALLVAWDLPGGPGRYGSGDYCADCGRGAFGTSLWQQAEFRQQEWNPTLRFNDGSRVWIFPELSMDLPVGRVAYLDPETGEPAPEAHAALVEVADHPGCLYRVWSSYGPDHVEYLVGQMRFVED